MIKKPTLKDISEITGLSITSISLVLNDKENRVSSENRKLIISAAEKIGYKINPLLYHKQSPSKIVIGMILPEISNVFFADLVQGVVDRTRNNNAQLILTTSDESAEKESEQMRQLIDAGISALLIAPSYNCHPSLFEKVDFPIIQVDRQTPSLSYSSVRLNNKKGGYIATKHLLDLGHKDIACITGPQHVLSAQERTEGVKWAFYDTYKDISRLKIFEGDYLMKSGYAYADQIVKSKCSAIFCENDMMAVGVYKRLRELGLVIGEDISIVGFDDISFCDCLEVPLTSVYQSGYDIGYTACARAFYEIENPLESKQTVFFEPKLIIRESSRQFVERKNEKFF